MAALTIPLQADKPYKRAVKALADEHGVSMAELVREALDRVYGTELEPHLSFFESRVTQKLHSSIGNDEKGRLKTSYVGESGNGEIGSK